jgi:hypothetical protein
MKSSHLAFLVLIAFAGYLIGVKYPSFGAQTLAKIGV